jgi:hypothetical protein
MQKIMKFKIGDEVKFRLSCKSNSLKKEFNGKCFKINKIDYDNDIYHYMLDGIDDWVFCDDELQLVVIDSDRNCRKKNG